MRGSSRPARLIATSSAAPRAPASCELGGHERVTSQPIVALLRDERGQHRNLRTRFGDRERYVCGTGERGL